MKLQFDANQTFQLDAVEAVADLFEGQPQGTPEFSIVETRVRKIRQAEPDAGEVSI